MGDISPRWSWPRLCFLRFSGLLDHWGIRGNNLLQLSSEKKPVHGGTRVWGTQHSLGRKNSEISGFLAPWGIWVIVSWNYLLKKIVPGGTCMYLAVGNTAFAWMEEINTRICKSSTGRERGGAGMRSGRGEGLASPPYRLCKCKNSSWERWPPAPTPQSLKGCCTRVMLFTQSIAPTPPLQILSISCSFGKFW